MKKFSIRVFSTLIAVLMVLSIIPFTASAASVPDLRLVKVSDSSTTVTATVNLISGSFNSVDFTVGNSSALTCTNIKKSDEFKSFSDKNDNTAFVGNYKNGKIGIACLSSYSTTGPVAVLTFTKKSSGYKLTANDLYIVVTSCSNGTSSQTVNSTDYNDFIPLPSNVTAKAGIGSAVVSWSAVDGATGYKLYYKKSGDSKFTSKSVNGTSCTLSGLTNGAKYIFAVKAYKTVKYTDPVNALSYTQTNISYSSKYADDCVIGVVTGVKAATASATSIKASWSALYSATGYYVYYSTTGKSGSWTRKSTTSTSYTATSLSRGKTYYFIVRPYNKSSNGANCDMVNANASKVSGAAAYATSNTSIKATWSKESGASGYYVYYSTTGKAGSWSKKTTTSNSYTFTSLKTGTVYYYCVKAYNSKGAGLTSSTVTAYATKVSGLSASKKSSTSATVKWSKATNASGYEIYRATSKSGSYSKVKTTTSTSYTNTGLAKKKTYYYKVRAYKNVGNTKVYGAFSSVSSGVKL